MLDVMGKTLPLRKPTFKHPPKWSFELLV